MITFDAHGYDASNLRVSVQDATGSRRILLDGMEELAEYATTSPGLKLALLLTADLMS